MSSSLITAWVLTAGLLAAGPQTGTTENTPQTSIEAARALLATSRPLKALEAIEELQNATREFPDNAELWHTLGTVYISQGRLVEAFKAIETALEIEPQNKDYQLALGEMLARAGQPQESLQLLERAASEPDGLPEALITLASVYEKLERSEDVYRSLEAYLAKRPEDETIRLLLGEQLTAAKRNEDALAVYRAGLTGDQGSASLLYQVAENVARQREGYEEAEALARRTLELEPGHLEAALLLARIFERTDRLEESRSVLEQARTAHPESPQVHYALATTYQRLGHTEEARDAAAQFQDLTEAEKKDQEKSARIASTYKRAADLLQRGQMLSARAEFERVLALDQGHAPTLSMLAKIHFSNRDVASALSSIRLAIAEDDTVAEYHYLLALFLFRAGDAAAAEAPARRSTELAPGFPDGWSLLGTILSQTGRAEEAIDCYLNAATLEPANPAIQLNLASAYATLGRGEDERSAMERYEELVGR